MPHRIAILSHLKMLAGATGAGASGWTLLAMDPDHAKALILAIGGGCIALFYLGLKEVVPVYVSARKQLKQMVIDMQDMDRKVQDSQGSIDDLAARATEAEAKAKAAEAKAMAAEEKAEKVAGDAEDAQHRREVEREFHNRVLLSLKSRLRLAEEQLRTLPPRMETAARGIDANSAGVRELAAHLDVDVPTAPQMDGGHGAMDPPPTAPSVTRPTILIVEDDEPSRKILGEEFRAAGWEPILTGSGVEASAYVHSGVKPPDVALVDLGLPGVPGVEVIRLIRESLVYGRATRAPIRIVGYTGRESDTMRADALSAGADSILPKPCTWEEILAAVAGRPDNLTPDPDSPTPPEAKP